MMSGVCYELMIMIAFSVESESAGSPSFFQVSISASELRKFLKSNLFIFTAESQFWRVFSLTISFWDPR
jgi:hypothetical protein